MNQRDLELSRSDVQTVVVQSAMDEDEVEIDLVELMWSVLRDWKVIVVATLLCALLGVAATKVMPKAAASKSYNASTTVYIAKQDAMTDVEATSPVDMILLHLLRNSKTGYNPAQEFRTMVSDRMVAQRIIDDLDLKMNASALANSFVVTDEKNTRLLRIDYQNADSELAKAILERLCDVSLASLAELMGNEPIISGYTDVTLEETVSGGGLSGKKLVILAAAVGFILAAMLSAVLAIFDRRLRSAEDVERYIDLPIMAVVPDDRR